jgi:heme exporter protein C
MNRRLDGAIGLLWLVVAVSMPVAIGLVFLYVPDEKVMGAAQRIFYFHVPSAFVTFLAVFVLLAGSVGYLWTRNLGWDNLSRAATETALVFCTIVLTTGPLWAMPAWGVWWTW